MDDKEGINNDPSFNWEANPEQNPGQVDDDPYAAYEQAKAIAGRAKSDPYLRAALAKELGLPEAPQETPKEEPVAKSRYATEIDRLNARITELNGVMGARDLTPDEATEYNKASFRLTVLPDLEEQHQQLIRQQQVAEMSATSGNYIKSLVGQFPVDKQTREMLGVTDEIVMEVLSDGYQQILRSGNAEALRNPQTVQALMRMAWTDMTMKAAKDRSGKAPAVIPDPARMNTGGGYTGRQSGKKEAPVPAGNFSRDIDI